MKRKIKILIVDDHPFFRQGVSFYLNGLEDFQLVGEVSSGEAALEMISLKESDVILMDLQMSEMDGIAATKALLEKNPNLRILVLTSFGSEDKIHRALEAGAAGYCLKDAPPEELITAIRAVAGGGTYLGQGITPKILTKASKEQQSIHNEENKLIQDLTDREIDVLRLIAQGLGNKEIAEKLFIGEKTVKTHVSNILSKLNLKTRTQAAVWANKQNLF